MKVIGYVRLSRAVREESTSVVRQREIIEETCRARGHELVRIVEDIDVSASKRRLDRPGLTEVRSRIGSGEADAVMVWRLDRLARSVVDLGTLLDEGLQIISATETVDTTDPMGRAMVEILQVFASMEATTIGLRVSASQEHLRSVGRFPGGMVPYGYRTVPHPNGAGRALEPDPVEASVVRRMVAEVLEGRSIYAVTAGLNADGIPTRRFSTWSPTVVRRLLRSGSVLGRVLTGTKAKDGKRQPGDYIRDPETGLPITFWEPLLTIEEAERVRALTDWTSKPDHAGRIREGRRRASRLLSGMIFCPGCGNPLTVRGHQNSPRAAMYACAAGSRGFDCPGGISVHCDRVEAEVERQFLAAYGHLRTIEERTLQREVAGLAAVVEAIGQTTDALRAPDADVLALVDRLTALRAERDRLDAAPSAPVVELVETGRTFAEDWHLGDTAARRRLLGLAAVAIEVVPRGRGGNTNWDPSRVNVQRKPDYLTAVDFTD